ncbi:long chain acyl-CoA synthetase 8 [Tanacetum coccineum]
MNLGLKETLNQDGFEEDGGCGLVLRSLMRRVDDESPTCEQVAKVEVSRRESGEGHNFVDLAGSERASQTNADGSWLREGCHISNLRRIIRRDPIGQGYGLTETCAGAAFSEADDNFVGRVGPPLPSCFMDESGYLTSDKPMPIGEVSVGWYSVTASYFNNELYEVDESGMRWFYTGIWGGSHPMDALKSLTKRIVEERHGLVSSMSRGDSESSEMITVGCLQADVSLLVIEMTRDQNILSFGLLVR